ncbi:signal recognition particle protein [bacterium BMS3Abin14]|nr:signal recognition particle protein [bacterium BMS3Abin14]
MAMMFQNLTDKFENIFKNLKNKGRLTEKDLDTTLREVKLALLEADVNFKVVKVFVSQVRQRSMGADVLESLTPAQQVIKIVNSEMTAILGGGRATLEKAAVPPLRIMLVGLQGAGKTTTAAKLGLFLKNEGHRPYLIPADLSRPAAVKQLLDTAERAGIPAFSPGPGESSPVAIYRKAAVLAGRAGADTLIIDTAGRLHMDEGLMAEAAALAGVIHPHETLLVADSMTGQDAVHVAEAFNTRLGLTGIILTKLDGDARGGAALSMRQVTGVPIKFAGMGEAIEALEPFNPDRMSSRILGMGDMLTLIDRAGKAMEEKEAQKNAEKQIRGEFDLEDFRDQLRHIRSMGSIQDLLSMLPMPGKMKKSFTGEMDEKELVRISAIIDSMTLRERRNPRIIKASRKKRISAGSGTTIVEVNRLLKRFGEAKKMMKMMGKGRRIKGKMSFPP